VVWCSLADAAAAVAVLSAAGPTTPHTIPYQGMDRAMARYKVECTGCVYSASMRMASTSHVISSRAACDNPPEKIKAAVKCVRAHTCPVMCMLGGWVGLAWHALTAGFQARDRLHLALTGYVRESIVT
jgi:hypothetical protein